MKKIFVLILCLGLVSLLIGCQSEKSRAVEGAVIGGALGAGGGYAIGKQSHHGAEGAGIGAAVGALAGAVIGSQIAKPGQGQTASQPAAVNPNQMSVQQIIDLSRQGINENVIIDKIRLTNSKFNLTAADVNNLRQQGVSQRVIDVMQGL